MILKVGTDFSGLGSPEEALKRLGVPHEILFACEKDKYAAASYRANHTAQTFYNDVTTRDNSKTGYTDLYVFGFPCQAFSNAGKRLGFQDTRGTLFFNSLDYINQNRPRVFIAENVKGLLSHDKKKGTKGKYGNTFNTILDCLAITANGQYNLHKYDDCVNYHIYYHVLNTKNYGIPQNRERVFIVGFRDEADAVNFNYPKPIKLELRLKDMLQDNASNVFGCSQRGRHLVDGKRVDIKGADTEQRIELNENGICNCISTVQKDTLVLTDGVYPLDEKYYLSETALEYLLKDSGKWNDRLSMLNIDTADTAGCITANHAKGVPYNMLGISEPELIQVGQIPGFHSAGRIYSENGIGKTILTGNGGGVDGGKVGYYLVFNGKNYRIRRLTPRECFWLQGYSDEFFEVCEAIQSDTQLYKQAGNSITVDTIMHLLRNVLKSIGIIV